ncbi:MAG: CcmD family protein [Chloroflexota bacterium]|nr:CcmD family protein [Chloroflexota bacterium]MDE2840598.1 CcmD family protein [Chloroflexota bacterium]MDE2931068.1 CcmD family protein [Chloroflexota bacterium]
MDTIQNFDFLFAAYTILWVIVFGYFFFLTRQLADLRREVNALREERGNDDGASPTGPNS